MTFGLRSPHRAFPPAAGGVGWERQAGRGQAADVSAAQLIYFISQKLHKY